jgi:glucose-1-phosphate adenylyltransferase
MKKIIGIVNLHSNVDFMGLTERRPVASVSFLGRYGVIDFALSNMSNSGIDAVGVLIQEKPRSLFKHLGGGHSWNFNSKAGGVSLLYNEKYANNPKYNHDINNLIENIAFIECNMSDYIVIAPAHIITTMDYSKVLAEHEKSGADITMVYKKIDNANIAFVGGQILNLKKNTVASIDINKGVKREANISLETYILNMHTLVNIMQQARKVSAFYTLKDILAYVCDERKVLAHEYTGYARCMDSMSAYYKYSLEMLNPDVYSQVFMPKWPIYTITNDTPPTKYLANSNVKKSFVANGAIINGTVENSIIGREVVIGKGASIKNCIIFNGSKIADEAVLENMIIDKSTRIEKQIELAGTIDSPLYIKEGDVV